MYKCWNWGLFNLSVYRVIDGKALERHHSLYFLQYGEASFQGSRNCSIICLRVNVSCMLAKLCWEALTKPKPEWLRSFSSSHHEGTIKISFTESFRRYCCPLYRTGEVLAILLGAKSLPSPSHLVFVCNYLKMWHDVRKVEENLERKDTGICEVLLFDLGLYPAYMGGRKGLLLLVELIWGEAQSSAFLHSPEHTTTTTNVLFFPC